MGEAQEGPESADSTKLRHFTAFIRFQGQSGHWILFTASAGRSYLEAQDFCGSRTSLLGAKGIATRNKEATTKKHTNLIL